jgi:parvulin-like peptidyl-prolyl isomerase
MKGPRIFIITLFILIVILLIYIPYYQVYISPWNQTMVQVRDVQFSMRDVVERLRPRLTGVKKKRFEIATSTIQDLQNREIVKQEALRRNINVSEAEIDQEIRNRVKASARGEGDFEDLYADMLRRLRVDDKQFREWVQYDLFQSKLFGIFLKEQPKTKEHVHVFAIITGTQEKAEEIRNRLLKGEDFSKLAEEESIDLASAKKGGDLGWFPKDVEDLEVIGQVLAQGLMVESEKGAQDMRERIVAGEDIARLARLNSIDDSSREKEGELGWVSADYQTGPPYGSYAYELQPGEVTEPIDAGEGFWIVKVLEKSPSGKLIDDIAFNLKLGEIPLPLKTLRGYYVLKLEAKEKSHPLSDEHQNILASKAFKDWMNEQTRKGSNEGWIRWNWGSETYNWLNQHID